MVKVHTAFFWFSEMPRAVQKAPVPAEPPTMRAARRVEVRPTRRVERTAPPEPATGGRPSSTRTHAAACAMLVGGASTPHWSQGWQLTASAADRCARLAAYSDRAAQPPKCRTGHWRGSWGLLQLLLQYSRLQRICGFHRAQFSGPSRFDPRAPLCLTSDASVGTCFLPSADEHWKLAHGEG